MSKINAALVLEGGALRSVYSAGVLDSFLENKIEFPYIVGVSAGALNAGNYVSKQIGRSARVNIDYVDDPRYIGIGPLLKGKSIFNFDFLFGEPTKEWMPYDERTFLESKQRYVIGATNCRTGQQDFFERHTYKELVEILKASSTLPILSQIAYIGNEPYLDGGIVEAVPIKKAMEDGYEKIVVILTRSKGFQSQSSVIMDSLYKIYYRKYPNLVEKLCTMTERYNRLLDEIKNMEKQGKIFVIQPQNPVNVRRIERNKKRLRKLYEEGCKEGKAAIADMYKYLEV